MALPLSWPCVTSPSLFGLFHHHGGLGKEVRSNVTINFFKEKSYNLWGMSTMAHPSLMSSRCQEAGVVKEASKRPPRSQQPKTLESHVGSTRIINGS